MDAHILPDSRAKNETINSAVVDWPLPGGGTVRIEAVMIYCANCGTPAGYVPKENTTFVCWLCNQCYETYGEVAGTYAVADEEFCRNVVHEMEERFGHTLTDLEIAVAVDRGQLGTALEVLMRESPYGAKDHRPRKL